MKAIVMTEPVSPDSFLAILSRIMDLRARVEADSAQAIVSNIVMLVTRSFGGDPLLALSGARDQASVQARDLTLYLAHTQFKLSHELAGTAMGVSRTAATRAIARIEEARDDRVFNWKLEQLEKLLKREGV